MAALPKSAPSATPGLSRTTPKALRIAPRKTGANRASARAPIAAAKAKTHFLQLLSEIERSREPITITKRGRVVAQIVPAHEEKNASALDEMFGRTAGMLTITGDIVSPNWEDWGPEWR